MSSSLGNFNYSNASDGFVQQTFLGASIIDFSISAGFGDDSSSISVNLINDEYNSGDAQGLGLGDDVYHNGKNDAFVPPIMGSPVYFKFGTAHATVEQAFRKTVDDIYGENTSKDNPGHFHFAFGGVLQAINETRDTGGNPKFSANVVDPREVLANVQLILNNYAGSTFNNKNMYNIYGFLEYDLPENFSPPFRNADPITKRTFENGTSIYYGTDTYSDKADGEIQDTLGPTATSFPMTGQGFSRRGSQGIPYYRVAQGLSALMELSQPLPPIYKNAGFGGYINFRGYNYVVDLSGLPVLDKFYYLDFDKLTLLDLIQEICEVANHDFIVTLLPIINHPSMLHLYKYNQGKIAAQEMDKTIAGIIRIETIDRSVAQPPGSVISYINSLESRGVEVTKKNIGLELSNINTDKFVVGGNEVEMYYFTADADRLPEDDRLQWDLDKSLEQQILPYYGKLPGSALLPSTVSITKGFGSYQQILLDAGGLSAFGVGNYYVATEIELRAAMVSFERWTQFLLQYDNVYMESVEPNDVEEGMQLQTQLPADHPGVQNPLISNNYAVTVPRSVWPSDEPGYDIAGLPLSPCNPPYGYPLYWKRATQIGIPTSAATKVGNAANNIVKKVADATGKTLQQIQNPNGIEARGVDQTINPQLNSNINFNPSTSNFFSVASIDEANQLKKIADERIDRIISDVSLAKLSETIQFNSRVNRKSLSNAKKIHSWLKSIADECLGKKFLVKIPRQVNLFYDKEITQFTNQFGEKHIYKGPFGFVPREVTSDTEANLDFSMRESALVENKYTTRTYLNADESLLQPEDNYVGALKVNFNPIADKYEFNYKPEPQGGFWEYDLQFNFSANNEPLHVSQAIAPQDPTIFDLGNSRISAYVRFDNSQDLSFNGFSSDSIAQQSAQAGHFVPDLNYTLDNLSPGKPKDLPPQDTPKAKQVTFVKVTLDQKFYMAPKTSYVPVAVHGRVINQEFTLSAPREMLSPSGCDMVKATQYTEMVASPAPRTDGYSSTIKHFAGSYRYGQIQYEPDTDHVYALITLPNRVVPTVDSRLRDGQLQTYNTAQLKHFLAVDVVKGVDGFQVPNIAGTPTDLTGDFLLQPLGKDATAAVTKAREMVSFALPNKIEFCTPSPVYPDMVALPLMSTERCYGPWMSSQIGANLDIGGKVDYIKDENLTPWNFSGYELMNKSALIQAEFSNSLLLSSERGSFSIPTAPSGISIGKGLLNKGPLVTNMNVSVSTNGVTTDYQLDLYTPSFGKLKKQRLGAIAKIARTQQKLEDEKNALIRRGMSKNQSDVSLQVVYNNMLQQINNIQVNQPSLAQKDQASNPNQLVQTIIPQKTSEQTSDGSNSARHRHVAASTTDSKSIEAGGEIMQTDQNQLNASYHNTAASDTSRTLAAVSLEPGHNDMVSAEMPPHEAIKYLLESEDGLTNVSINRKPPEGAT